MLACVERMSASRAFKRERVASNSFSFSAKRFFIRIFSAKSFFIGSRADEASSLNSFRMRLTVAACVGEAECPPDDDDDDSPSSSLRARLWGGSSSANVTRCSFSVGTGMAVVPSAFPRGRRGGCRGESGRGESGRRCRACVAVRVLLVVGWVVFCIVFCLGWSIFLVNFSLLAAKKKCVFSFEKSRSRKNFLSVPTPLHCY